MLNSILSVLLIVIVTMAFISLFIVICLAASPKDRREEDMEQMNFLKQYLKGKDERD